MSKHLPSTGIEEAFEALLNLVPAPRKHAFELEDALGLALAESVVCTETHPAHDTSAMDGYAVVCGDLEAASSESPVQLEVIEDVRAGFPPRRSLKAGQASRISTGGLIPTGAEAVIMRELSIVPGEGVVQFSQPVPDGANIRRAGEHLAIGETVLHVGTKIGPPEIGMAAYLGLTELTCYAPPKVAILATGSELVKTGESVAKGQIRDSNSVSLAAACRQLGCEVVERCRVPDSPEALDGALEKAFTKADVVLTSGGISAGWHDLVKSSIEKRGGQFTFHKLRMRPGKPLGFGVCEDTLFFCLPGNPVSSMVTFELFAKPSLLRMMGRTSSVKRETAVLSERIEKKPGFSIFYRGIRQEEEDGTVSVRLTGPQGSHLLKSLVLANVLIATKENDRVLEPGHSVEIIPYNFV